VWSAQLVLSVKTVQPNQSYALLDFSAKRLELLASMTADSAKLTFIVLQVLPKNLVAISVRFQILVLAPLLTASLKFGKVNTIKPKLKKILPKSKRK